MSIDSWSYVVPGGAGFELGDRATRGSPLFASPQAFETELDRHIRRISALQELLYASDRHAVLLVFQGMDTAGKDGAIKHVMSGINPQGCDVHCYKEPSAAELQHDFLWRTTCDLPARGRVGIFNRSYYEEVVVTRVHPGLLAGEGIARSAHGEALWKGRYESIVDLERHLLRNGTSIIKFFLHLSKREQRRRLLERALDPQKNWKLSPDDLKERGYWKQYMKAYDACLGATSTAEAPWYVVPADDKDDARLIVSQILLDRLGALDLALPVADGRRNAELHNIRKRLGGSG